MPGPQRQLVTVLMGTMLMAGIMALAVVIWKRRLLQTLRNIMRMLAALFRLRMPGPEVSLDSPQSTKIPFGVAMALTVLIYWAREKRLGNFECSMLKHLTQTRTHGRGGDRRSRDGTAAGVHVSVGDCLVRAGVQYLFDHHSGCATGFDDGGAACLRDVSGRFGRMEQYKFPRRCRGRKRRIRGDGRVESGPQQNHTVHTRPSDMPSARAAKRWMYAHG